MVDAVILAGGEARRMGGHDKGLLCCAGVPLVQCVISRIAPQVDNVWISANRHVDDYARFGYAVIQDASADYLGPLAGVLAGLRVAQSEWVLIVPCDTPYLPMDLVAKMMASADDNVDVVVAEAERLHATVMLCRRDLAAGLRVFLAAGGRKVRAWQAQQRCVVVSFENEAAFQNMNTPAELAGAAS
ncbi:MAG: molybdenum cofactor guanylyltransferase [Sulfuriferula sp.]|nr:molybdenum cofactor guanylyltransferase [Sulfuriferula sp.]